MVQDIPPKEAWRRTQSASRAAKTLQLSDDDRFNDLVLWISTIPLSTKKSDRTDRAFCDGVLVAEIIAHHAPHICNQNQFFRAYSSTNKLVNWNHLNLTVFPLLGFKVKDNAIKKIINPMPFQGYGNVNQHPLYKLLFKLQDKLSTIDPNLYNYRKRSSERSVLWNKIRKSSENTKSSARPRSGQPTYLSLESKLAKCGSPFFNCDPDTQKLEAHNAYSNLNLRQVSKIGAVPSPSSNSRSRARTADPKLLSRSVEDRLPRIRKT